MHRPDWLEAEGATVSDGLPGLLSSSDSFYQMSYVSVCSFFMLSNSKELDIKLNALRLFDL